MCSRCAYDRPVNDDGVEVPVLIVGGSLVGLSTAMLLAWHGVDSLVVERHSGTAIHPRAGHFNLRTLEILRSVGLEETVRQVLEPIPPGGGISNVESLAGREIAVYFSDLNEGVAGTAPPSGCSSTRTCLSRSSGARGGRSARAAVRDGVHRPVAGRRRGDGRAHRRDDRARTRVRARYVVAADGNRSPVRNRLGIGMQGHGVLSKQHHDLLPGRVGPRAAAGRAEPGRALRDELGDARVLPARPERQPRASSSSTSSVTPSGRRSWRRTRRRAGRTSRGHHRVPCARTAARGDRRARDAGGHRGHRDLAGESPTSRTGTPTGGCSWPATRCTWSRRTAASAATPACTTRTTSPGSSRRCCTGRRA